MVWVTVRSSPGARAMLCASELATALLPFQVLSLCPSDAVACPVPQFFNFLSIEPNRSAELGFVDFEQGHFAFDRRFEGLLIPEIIAFLVDFAFPIICEPFLGCELGSNPVGQMLAAVKSIDVFKRWLSQV